MALNPSSETVIGQRLRRPDAPDKVKGTALYIEDLDFAGSLLGGVLRSPHAHARIRKLDTARARAVPGVRAVITAREIPGRNVIPMVQSDWPVLAQDFVRHVGEGVAVVAADTREALAEGLAAVQVEYEPLPALLDMEEALAAGEVMARYKVRRGEASVALTRSDLIVIEGTYHTPYQEHAYIEPNGMIAAPDGAGGVVVHGSMQCPFYVQKGVASALGLDLSHVRIVQTVTGGGFGGKEDAPSAPGAQAALLAMATGRPVRLILTREEDMATMSKRHPARVQVKLGATRNGHLIAAEIDYLLDGGAYATLSPVVLFRGTVHACGPYRVPNVKVESRVVRTHKVPCGAFRGFGEPQVVFAFEAALDELAERLGQDPLVLRLKNALQVGDETITGHRLAESVGFRDVLEQVAAASDWKRKREEYARDSGTVRRGIGLAASYYGVGLGAMGKHLNPAGANVVVAGDGSVTIAVGTTEIGQGMVTVLTQIAAESLGCPAEAVRVLEADTSRVPDSGPTVASRTTVMSGNAIRDAAAKIRAAMEPVIADSGLPWREAVALCVQKQIGLAAHGWAVPPATSFDLATGQGEAYVCYSFSANVVEVEVDTETGETRVKGVWSGHDVGRVVNPTLGEGQVEGGVVQGLGYALTEEHALRDGRILNDQFSTYIIPTPLDVPEIKSVLVESPFPWGPYGAKGLGETPIIAIAPAVVAAIHHAAGVRLNALPATPERVWEAIRALPPSPEAPRG
ncbi:MAG TPA: xanthine dehydrogenase family protein molybdopterin-binding subunit [Vicinamibacteria bacterium]|nr:xanthine dehydrogenase family protein molybdopterin-binding subunit [Vicinamibacteria bacterium]